MSHILPVYVWYIHEVEINGNIFLFLLTSIWKWDTQSVSWRLGLLA